MPATYKNLFQQVGELLVAKLRMLDFTGSQNASLAKSAWDASSATRGVTVVPLTESYERGTNLSDAVGYPFLVVNIRGSSGSGVDFSWLDWRRKVREALHHKQLTGIGEVYVCRVIHSDVYLPKQLKAGYEGSAVKVTAWAEENRA